MKIVNNHKGFPSLQLPKGSSIADKRFYETQINRCVDWASSKFTELDLAVCQDGTVSSRIIDENGKNLFYIVPMWSLKSMLCKMYMEENAGKLKPTHVNKVLADFLPRLIKSCQELDISTLAPGKVVISADEDSHLELNTLGRDSVR